MKLSELMSDLEDLYACYGDMILVENEEETNTFYNVSIGYKISGYDLAYSKKSLRLTFQRGEEI